MKELNAAIEGEGDIETVGELETELVVTSGTEIRQGWSATGKYWNGTEDHADVPPSYTCEVPTQPMEAALFTVVSAYRRPSPLPATS